MKIIVIRHRQYQAWSYGRSIEGSLPGSGRVVQLQQRSPRVYRVGGLSWPGGDFAIEQFTIPNSLSLASM